MDKIQAKLQGLSEEFTKLQQGPPVVSIWYSTSVCLHGT